MIKELPKQLKEWLRLKARVKHQNPFACDYHIRCITSRIYKQNQHYKKHLEHRLKYKQEGMSNRGVGATQDGMFTLKSINREHLKDFNKRTGADFSMKQYKQFISTKGSRSEAHHVGLDFELVDFYSNKRLSFLYKIEYQMDQQAKYKTFKKGVVKYKERWR